MISGYRYDPATGRMVPIGTQLNAALAAPAPTAPAPTAPALPPQAGLFRERAVQAATNLGFDPAWARGWAEEQLRLNPQFGTAPGAVSSFEATFAGAPDIPKSPEKIAQEKFITGLQEQITGLTEKINAPVEPTELEKSLADMTKKYIDLLSAPPTEAQKKREELEMEMMTRLSGALAGDRQLTEAEQTRITEEARAAAEIERRALAEDYNAAQRQIIEQGNRLGINPAFRLSDLERNYQDLLADVTSRETLLASSKTEGALNRALQTISTAQGTVALNRQLGQALPLQWAGTAADVSGTLRSPYESALQRALGMYGAGLESVSGWMGGQAQRGWQSAESQRQRVFEAAQLQAELAARKKEARSGALLKGLGGIGAILATPWTGITESVLGTALGKVWK